MEKNILLEEIIKKFDLYKKQEITYDEFLNMYNGYSNKFTEIEFADLLGVKRKTFIDFKRKIKNNKNIKLTILANRSLTEEEKIKKMLELTRKYDLNKGKEIRYVFFKRMWEEVKTVLTEIEFADLLGISAGNLRNQRSSNGKMRIFKNCNLSDEKTEKIRRLILSQYEGKKTYYESNENNKGEVDFLELYKPYRIYFSHKEFAELLGISEKNLWYTKKHLANPYIKDVEKMRKIAGIKNELDKMGYLRKDEIEGLCQKLEISVEDFITYYINNGKFFDAMIYKSALDTNNGLYIKKGKIEERYMQEYCEIFFRISRTVATGIKNSYAETFYDEDLQNSVLLFILENCKDLVKNFKYDTKLMERMIWLRSKQYAKIIYLTEKIKNAKITSFNDEIKVKNNQINDIKLRKTNSIEENNINDEQLADIFKNWLVQGYSREEILEALSTKLNTGKTEIINRMKKYLLENQQVEPNDNNDYEIGE